MHYLLADSFSPNIPPSLFHDNVGSSYSNGKNLKSEDCFPEAERPFLRQKSWVDSGEILSLKRIGLISIIALALLFAVTIVLNLVEGLVYCSPSLLLVLNTLFLTLMGITIAVISAESYLNEGSAIFYF